MLGRRRVHRHLHRLGPHAERLRPAAPARVGQGIRRGPNVCGGVPGGLAHGGARLRSLPQHARVLQHYDAEADAVVRRRSLCTRLLDGQALLNPAARVEVQASHHRSCRVVCMQHHALQVCQYESYQIWRFRLSGWSIRIAWARQQADSNNNSSDFWAAMGLVLRQFDGLHAGYGNSWGPRQAGTHLTSQYFA